MGAGIAQVGVANGTACSRYSDSLPQVSLQKGYGVILKDNAEQGVARGYQQVYNG